MAKKDYTQLADAVIKDVGGKDNIRNVIHCITRLRFYLKDESKANDDALRENSGVLDVIHASGQYQVIIGNEVANVFDAVSKQLGADFSDDQQDTTDNNNDQRNPITRGFENLIGFITGAMSPVIGVIAASGIIKGILALLTLPQLGSLLSSTSVLYITISAIADSAFYFLPILVGYAAAKRLNSDPIVAAVIGGVLAYPSIVNYGKTFKLMFEIGGFKFQFLNYTYSIFPMILAAYMAKKLSEWLKEHLPSYLQMIFNPLITVMIVSAITLVITGPIIQGFANGIADVINWLVNASGWFGGFIIGGFYQVLVIFGLHWGVVPLVAQQITGSGQSALNAIICSTMVSQGAAVLAVAIKSHKDNIKEVGFAAAISAFCGVTEPAIYGVNLRYRKVFISGLMGSAVGGLITGLMHGTMYGFTGSLIGFSSFFNPKHPTGLNSFYAFLFASAAALVVSFVATWFWGYNDNMEIGKKVEKKQRPGSKITTQTGTKETLSVPVEGEVIPLSKVNDQVFSAGTMGEGFAVEPTKGILRAPVDAEVTVAYETGHAIGLTTMAGAEVLLHIGLDTVMMKGKGFDVKVKQEQFVKRGDVLVEFDIDAIKKAGYDPTVIVVITDPHGVDVVTPALA
ncbi:beta-glucoside-specific PTS transporter subunit IIABC [Ligilactobacillus sp. WILCCON 0076]|uniref:PTS system sucrose-specific EIIBCA component n=1 Tax=Ligilactobacillus ubinensis TaxID=2876789 RepID=A0A9X2FMY6_9LACO|nr:beta-glucoside-specific PTS transporter subunit IIABC [Ligilactobacillus ubinensis]MCP0887949.1 beta-glucoside-specific PTS transporter subunit IIABC [Ligilactobacillus ubinensis]